MVEVVEIFQLVPSLQAEALIAEEEREKRKHGSKGAKGSKLRRRKAGAKDPPPVRDCYAALSA